MRSKSVGVRRLGWTAARFHPIFMSVLIRYQFQEKVLPPARALGCPVAIADQQNGFAVNSVASSKNARAPNLSMDPIGHQDNVCFTCKRAPRVFARRELLSGIQPVQQLAAFLFSYLNFKLPDEDPPELAGIADLPALCTRLCGHPVLQIPQEAGLLLLDKRHY